MKRKPTRTNNSFSRKLKIWWLLLSSTTTRIFAILGFLFMASLIAIGSVAGFNTAKSKNINLKTDDTEIATPQLVLISSDDTAKKILPQIPDPSSTLKSTDNSLKATNHSLEVSAKGSADYNESGLTKEFSSNTEVIVVEPLLVTDTSTENTYLSPLTSESQGINNDITIASTTASNLDTASKEERLSLEEALDKINVIDENSELTTVVNNSPQKSPALLTKADLQPEKKAMNINGNVEDVNISSDPDDKKILESSNSKADLINSLQKSEIAPKETQLTEVDNAGSTSFDKLKAELGNIIQSDTPSAIKYENILVAQSESAGGESLGSSLQLDLEKLVNQAMNGDVIDEPVPEPTSETQEQVGTTKSTSDLLSEIIQQADDDSPANSGDSYISKLNAEVETTVVISEEAAQLPAKTGISDNDRDKVIEEIASKIAKDSKETLQNVEYVTVQQNDSLWFIAKRLYGDPFKYKLLYSANRDLLSNENSLIVGQKIRIPKLDK